MSDDEELDDLPTAAPPGGPLTGPRSDESPSFRQKLESRFGPEVDPGIDLQAREGDVSGQSSMGLVRKLSEHGTVSGRYEIRQEIARGGMGTVLRVWDDDLRRNLAMKVLRSKERIRVEGGGADIDNEKLVRFLEEAQITGQLDHPGIVPVHDLGIDSEGRCYFTMRLVRGRELKDVLDDAREGRGGWTRTKALSLILKVCETMAFSHAKGVVHRDLKPSNIMVGRYGEVYVMDWGLARVLGRSERRTRPAADHEPSSLTIVRTVRKDESERDPTSPLVTMDGDVVGTPSYMAIEQAQGKLDEIGPHSDVYSLGTILYYMLTGRSPYVAPGERVSPHVVLARALAGPPEPVSKFAKDQPAELIAITEKAMQRDAADRYATMEEVAEDIQAYLDGRVVGAYEGGAIAETRKWVLRNRGIAVTVAAMVILALASALGFAFQKQKRIRELGAEQEQTRRARDAAESNAAAAEANLIAAEKARAESEESYKLAEEKRREAERSGYVANITAADYSLRLDDVTEARIRLTASSDLLREWEWWHLYRRAYPALSTWSSSDSRPIDTIHWSRSAEGDRLFALSSDGRLRVLDGKTGRQIGPESAPLVGAAAVVLSSLVPLEASFSPDEERVAIAGAGTSVTIFEIATSSHRIEVPPAGAPGHGARVGTVAYSPDGRYLVTGADNGSVLLWDQDYSLVTRFPAHSGAVTDLSWSPDSTRVASASVDGTIQVWDVVRGERAGTLTGRPRSLRSLVWDANGSRLFAGGEDGVIDQWNAETGRLLNSFSGHHGPIRGLAFDPVFGRLASASEDRTVRVWDPATGAAVVLRGHEEAVLDVVFQPDGHAIVSSDAGGGIKTWDVRGDLTTTDLVFHTRRIEDVAFSRDGKRILTGDAGGEVILWDGLAGKPVARLRGHEGAIIDVAFAPDGASAYSSSADGSVRRWSIPEGRETAYFGHDAPVTGLLVLPDGERILTACSDKKVRIFDVESRLLKEEFEGYRAPLSNLTLAPSGEVFAGTANNYVVLRPVDGGERPLDPFHRPSSFQDCVFAPMGMRLATASLRGEVCLWDASTGHVRSFRRDHAGPALALAYHPEGRRIASGGVDGTVRIRDAETGESVLVLPWADKEVTTLEFSRDGTRLMAGAMDGSVRVWETGQVQERRRAYLALEELEVRAVPLVEKLFDRVFFLDNVLSELQRDRSLDEALRQEAIRLANFRGDNAQRLAARSLAEVVPSGVAASVREHALARAEAAASLPDGARSPEVQLALGVCLVRGERWGEGRDVLRGARALSDEMRASRDLREAAFTPVQDVVAELFLSMALLRLGEESAGRVALERARTALTNDAELASHRDQLQGVLQEVDGIGGG
ncbi:MAG TPA: hypothetical protein ENJ09_04235 [Planctomycetes bacterium]|nr:hypothetical protein [Planctomycetota bacterium]